MFSEFEPGDLKLNCRIFDDNSNKTLEDYIIEYNKKTLKYKYEIKKNNNNRNRWELGYYCSNLFSKFITINDYIKFDQVITKKYDESIYYFL